MNEILARSVIVFQRSGHKIKYTHVTKFEFKDDYLYVTGETDDFDGSRYVAYDKYERRLVDGVFLEPYKEPK